MKKNRQMFMKNAMEFHGKFHELTERFSPGKSNELKEGTRLQLQRSFYQTAPTCNLRQIVHIYPITFVIVRKELLPAAQNRL
jgi:hypothetical protein